MVQRDKRSIPLGYVPFTESTANKGNVIRVLSREALICLTVLECIVFSILEHVCATVPAWPFDPAAILITKPQNMLDHWPKPEAIIVKKVVCAIPKKDKNRLKVILQESPKRILSCKIKNLTLAKRIAPNPSGEGNLALAIYDYEIKIRYQDLKGELKQEYFNSGIRCQQAILEPQIQDFSVEFSGLCTAHGC
ncbi:MAG: hypothetical protein GX325_06950 [Peptococcaceae bacterium]|nr:hypothetical protein [Peptococcaceae bacterium]